MRRGSRRLVTLATTVLSVGVLAACDTQAPFAPSLPRVVGLQVDGEQLRVLTGAPCEDVDRIVVVFSGDGVQSRRAQLEVDSAATVDQVVVGADVEVTGFETTEALPPDFDWRNYSEMDLGLSGPGGEVGGATSDLEPVEDEGAERSGDGTAFVRDEGWLTRDEIAAGDTTSFLTACTPDPEASPPTG